jgi:hypothetical protein
MWKFKENPNPDSDVSYLNISTNPDILKFPWLIHWTGKGVEMRELKFRI